ncbi:multiple sugar transport system substrate-binding protein [Pelomonas saccharophila]|uniref:Multiple sugar transport system substrate-binding protein n=1 Tax=Roseateles saccharophilus TaxID=304 RepID=A0ABU1YV56_ROSSA|nr:sugar ABC transporter substrate-binding protein [Roseateles saccharophilus]MDR7272737.1 multiple sugar transport system substrate-binding protein [Roseateles saccharophilus]
MKRRDLLTVTAAAALTGCAQERGTTLRFWAMGRESEVVAELMPAFEREHPGVRVKVEQLPWTAAHEKLLTAFAGDATPDLAQVGNTWLPEMQALGALEPLEPWLARTPMLAAGDYFEGIWATNAPGGQRVGLPWYVDTRLMFVRQDLLAKAGIPSMPVSWDDWRATLARLRERGMDKPMLLPTNESAPLLALALQQPGEVLRDGGRYGNFSGAGFRKALAFYLERFQRGEAPGVSEVQIGNLWQEFGRGNFAFYMSGPWDIGEFKRRLPPELANAWITAELPGPDGPGASIAGGASLVMFKRARHKPEVWALISYLSRPDVQLEFYRLTGDLPARRSAWALPLNGATLAEDRHAAAFHRQLQRVRAAPAVPEWERIEKEMQLAATRAVHGVTDLDTTVKRLDALVDGILEKRRWMLDRKAGA